MRFDTKALLKLMKQSWRGGGVKIQPAAMEAILRLAAGEAQ